MLYLDKIDFFGFATKDLRIIVLPKHSCFSDVKQIKQIFNKFFFYSFYFSKLKLAVGVYLQATKYSFTISLIVMPLVRRHLSTTFFGGRDKRAYIAVLRQAKIYTPRQLRQPLIMHCGCRNARDEPQSMRWIISTSWIVAVPQQALKRLNISPFLRSPSLVCISIIILHSFMFQIHGGHLCAASMYCSMHLCFYDIHETHEYYKYC